MRRPAVHLIILLVTVVAVLEILASAQLFATVDGPLRIYLPTIFKQADGGTADHPAGDGDSNGGDDDVFVPSGFEIEGNLVVDGEKGTDFDWEPPDPDVVHIEDPHSKKETDLTIFKPDGKFDQPESWTIRPGKVGPGQNELTNIMAWFIKRGSLPGGVPSDDWLIMGMERTKKEGTFFLDFEFNQSVWDPAKGGLSRTYGDVVVGFELKGNPTDREKDLSVLIIQYLEKQPSSCEVTPGTGNMPAEVKVGTDPCPAYGDGGFYYRFLADGAILADSGLGEATMNAEPLPVPAGWHSYDSQGRPRDVIPPFQFAEAAINLKALDTELDCATYSSMHAKDRSSLEPNADLKDLAGPIETEINCLINGHKFHDLDGNGLWDRDAEVGLEGWVINIENLDPEIDWRGYTETNAEGFYEFDWLKSGTYKVSETCPANGLWLQTSPGLTDFEGCGSKTYTLTINLENREETNKDFGNIDPGLEVQKLCKPDVSVGDRMPYTITVMNTGGTVLNNISVDDTLLGHLGDIATLEPDASEVMTATYIARVVGPITNTVTVSKTFSSVTTSESVTISDEDSCVTEARVSNLFLAFEDKPMDKDIDFDYNDFVINVEISPTFLENGNASHISFLISQVADLSGASHKFYIAPDFTTIPDSEKYLGCDGWYTKEEDAPVPFKNGAEIFVSSDTTGKNQPFEPVSLTIAFTATNDGCELDISATNLIKDFHCQDCFLSPRLVSSSGNPAKTGWTETTIPDPKLAEDEVDVRMLSIPIPNWHWPYEHKEDEPCQHYHLSTCYNGVSPEGIVPPHFEPYWWKEGNWKGPTRECPDRHPDSH